MSNGSTFNPRFLISLVLFIFMCAIFGLLFTSSGSKHPNVLSGDISKTALSAAVSDSKISLSAPINLTSSSVPSKPDQSLILKQVKYCKLFSITSKHPSSVNHTLDASKEPAVSFEQMTFYVQRVPKNSADELIKRWDFIPESNASSLLSQNANSMLIKLTISDNFDGTKNVAFNFKKIQNLTEKGLSVFLRQSPLPLKNQISAYEYSDVYSCLIRFQKWHKSNMTNEIDYGIILGHTEQLVKYCVATLDKAKAKKSREITASRRPTLQ